MEQESVAAVSLMRMALALLDRAAETEAACQLQQAIDIATHAQIPSTIEEAEAQLDTPEAQAILRRLWPERAR